MRFALLTAAIVFSTAAAANAAAVQDAHKVCLDRYNLEKAGGTIPVGMSKQTYMNQCTGSIRRAAKLEQELAAQGASNNATNEGGSNEVTATAAKPARTTNKPARVKTTLQVGATPSN